MNAYHTLCIGHNTRDSILLGREMWIVQVMRLLWIIPPVPTRLHLGLVGHPYQEGVPFPLQPAHLPSCYSSRSMGPGSLDQLSPTYSLTLILCSHFQTWMYEGDLQHMGLRWWAMSPELPHPVEQAVEGRLKRISTQLEPFMMWPTFSSAELNFHRWGFGHLSSWSDLQ